jgi:type II secretory pathway component GspD/PulD (secretin)
VSVRPARGALAVVVATGIALGLWGGALVRADEAIGTPFVGPGGELRLLFRPEFRSPLVLVEDMKPFAIAGLRVDAIGPTIATAPPPIALDPRPAWARDGIAAWPVTAPVPAAPPLASRLLLQGSPEAVARGREVLHYLDVPRPAVLVSLLVLETRCLAQNESGGSVTFDRSPGGPDPGGAFQGFASDFEPDAFLRASLTGARPFDGTSVTVGDGGYDQVFRMLVRRNEAEYLAWPTLRVSEGETGSITSTVALPQVLFTRQTAQRVVSTKAEEAGIRLDVVPVSVGFEEAVLDLATWIRVAEPSSETDAPAGTLVLRSRQVRTRVTIRDRESMLIGGLRMRRHLGSRRGLPLLQRIPGLDPLYSVRRRENEETEIVILVRARILNPGRSRAPFAPPSEMQRLQDAR